MARQTHQQVQAGGDPAHGPHPDLANPTPGPAVGNDFPDAPPAQSEGRDQDKPDLDAFAARIGTDTLAADTPSEAGPAAPTATTATRSPLASVSEAATTAWRRPVASVVTGLAGGARDVASRLRSAAGALSHDSEGEIDLAALRARVDGIRTVMVTTGDGRGTLSSRPLTVQRVCDDGDVLFIVDETADWVKPGTAAVNVAFVDSDRTWISVAGRSTLDDDPTVLDELWNPMIETFFPDGRDHAVVLRVEADRWEYWTAPGRLRQLVELGTARLTDSPPDLGDSGTITT